MSNYDVIIIGAGAAGLTAGALLSKEGKRVLVVERSTYVGGRGAGLPDEGFTINLGGHLLEDGGSGITRVLEVVGKKLVHGESSNDLPVWDHEHNRWGSVRDRYQGSKTELKKVIKVLEDTPYEALNEWDDRSLREWLLQYTTDQGVIDLFEFIAVLEALTDQWWDHSASDNLFMRKMHYAERHKAAYSFWPEQGWAAIFNDLRDAAVDHGAEIRLGTTVDRIVIENGEVKGIAVARTPKVIPNEIFEDDVIEAPCVISTLPAWRVLDIIDERDLPDWYVAQIKQISRPEFRGTWLGLYLATEEPAPVIDRRELSTWLHAPLTHQPGFFFEQTAMDPSTAPPGIFLYTMGCVVSGAKVADRRYLREMFDKFEAEIGIMYPGLANPVWRRRHLVFDPALGVLQKPCLVGSYRPHWRPPNVDGLLFATETFKSRGVGVDRAARAAITTVETYLGRRLPEFADTPRY